MTSLNDRPNTALLVIDMQRNVVADSYDVDSVVDNINTLIAKARGEDVPVVWVQHHGDDMPMGSEGWKYFDELQRLDDEPLVHKRFGDSFEDTALESLLAERGVGRVVVTGAQTDACIRSTLHGALGRGYDAILVSDAHTTEDMRQWGSEVSPAQVIAHTNLYWSFSNAPGRSGSSTPTADVAFTST